MGRHACLALVAVVAAVLLPAVALAQDSPPSPAPPSPPAPPGNPIPTWTINDLVNMGCYFDNKLASPGSPQRVFPVADWQRNLTSLERCIRIVQLRCWNCTVFGLFKDYCLYGNNDLNRVTRYGVADNCTYPCKANTSQTCGGDPPPQFNLYALPQDVPPPGPPEPPSPPRRPPGNPKPPPKPPINPPRPPNPPSPPRPPRPPVPSPRPPAAYPPPYYPPPAYSPPAYSPPSYSPPVYAPPTYFSPPESAPPIYMDYPPPMYGPYPPAYPPPYGCEHDHYLTRRMNLEVVGEAADISQPKAFVSARVWVGSRSQSAGIRSCEDAGALQHLRASVAGAAWVTPENVNEVGCTAVLDGDARPACAADALLAVDLELGVSSSTASDVRAMAMEIDTLLEAAKVCAELSVAA